MAGHTHALWRASISLFGRFYNNMVFVPLLYTPLSPRHALAGGAFELSFSGRGNLGGDFPLLYRSGSGLQRANRAVALAAPEAAHNYSLAHLIAN